ncbi:MAG: hypothetical protein KatS3mg035_0615 [Bacteroidia bacterium]|nr:MAG: hypothetical protein KatS3mg035_0615 [Bacteroidia bacterium]
MSTQKSIGNAPSNASVGPELRKKYCRFKKFGIKYIDYKDS